MYTANIYVYLQYSPTPLETNTESEKNLPEQPMILQNQ